LVKTVPDFYFGYGSWWGSANLLIDNLLIYKTALTADEIFELYEAETTTSMNKVRADDITISVNRENKSICIGGKQSGERVDLLDFTGKHILSTNKSVFSTSSLPAGVYFLKINKGNDVVVKKVFIP
jgi:hypothetical protein